MKKRTEGVSKKGHRAGCLVGGIVMDRKCPNCHANTMARGVKDFSQKTMREERIWYCTRCGFIQR